MLFSHKKAFYHTILVKQYRIWGVFITYLPGKHHATLYKSITFR